MYNKNLSELIQKQKNNPDLKDKIDDYYAKTNLQNTKPLLSKELIDLQIEPKKILLSPWLKEQQIAMIYAPPGTGKTFFAMNCAYSLATGKRFLNFDATKIDSVMYIDAEMDIGELQERWKLVTKNNNDLNVHFYTPSLFDEKIVPKISTKEEQQFYENKFDEYKTKVVIFDNLSMLNHLDENKANEWSVIQNWLVKLKNSGMSVILIHHTNKGKKEYRGSSKIKDILNSVLFLEEIQEENQKHTARFKVKYDKKRGFYGDDAKEFEAWLGEDGMWHTQDPVISNRIKVIQFYKSGMSAKEISIDLSIQPRTVYRYLEEAEIAGMIKKRSYGK